MKNRLQFHDLAHKFMRITIFQLLMCTVFINVSFGSETNAQDILNKNITLNLEDQPVKTVLNQLEKLSEAQFLYSSSLIQVNRKVNINVNNKPLGEVLNTLLRPLRLNYKLSGKQIILNRTEDNAEEPSPNEQNISGVVRDEKGEAMPGVNIVIKGTAKGIVTDANGQFRINIPSNNAVLVISFVGYEKNRKF
ncbi:carboxypeptidase-like regulatory domain-containing protein [Pseudarcicella hirudinis]|uniref:STN domain-containing protein n=1 Tax=Pseudarcicella hirudinis TaxID=1079859 RepID=UPI0035EA5D3C